MREKSRSKKGRTLGPATQMWGKGKTALMGALSTAANLEGASLHGMHRLSSYALTLAKKQVPSSEFDRGGRPM